MATDEHGHLWSIADCLSPILGKHLLSTYHVQAAVRTPRQQEELTSRGGARRYPSNQEGSTGGDQVTPAVQAGSMSLLVKIGLCYSVGCSTSKRNRKSYCIILLQKKRARECMTAAQVETLKANPCRVTAGFYRSSPWHLQLPNNLTSSEPGMLNLSFLPIANARLPIVTQKNGIPIPKMM